MANFNPGSPTDEEYGYDVQESPSKSSMSAQRRVQASPPFHSSFNIIKRPSTNCNDSGTAKKVNGVLEKETAFGKPLNTAAS